MSLASAIKNCRVLVTGASGFIGHHVVEKGVALGAQVHSLSRQKIEKTGLISWCGDLTDEKGIYEIVAQIKPDAILHLAAGGVAYGTNTTPDLLKINTVGLATLLETVVSLNLSPSIVIAGSGFEYQPQNRPLKETDAVGAISGYGISKAAATMVADLYAAKMPITVLRLFSIYGSGEKEPRLAPYIIGQAKRGLSIELTAGEQIRDYTCVKDVAEAFWKVLDISPRDNKLQILNLGSNQPITLRSFIETLASELKKQGLIADLKFGVKPYRPNEPMYYTADISLLKTRLGWFPSTTLEQGLAEMVQELL